MNKFWNKHKTWQEAEAKWDQKASIAQEKNPLKKLRILPDMPGIAPSDKKHLKWKSFKYLVLNKDGQTIVSHILKRPFRYGFFYLRSLFIKQAYVRDGDFFLYGVKTLSEFEALLKKRQMLLVIGFSYCQKPFECPSGRFTDQCLHDVENLVCQQCDIGKALHALPEDRVIPLIIPTVHYIGEKLFEIREKHRNKNICFLITACEMTLEMFGDFGNMINMQGIGVRLDGRICNTMKAFILSEKGIKPGLTLVTSDTQKRLLSLIRTFREASRDTSISN